jgi:hypothetical protein
MTDPQLWHTIRRTDGSWPYPFGDVGGVTSDLGKLWSVACATNSTGDLHVLAVNIEGLGPVIGGPRVPSYALWHTIRRADGSWPYQFGNVGSLLAEPYPSASYGAVGCATNTVGDLHVLAKTYQGRLWHTIRLADGSWPYPFGNVDEVTSSNIGENYGAFACATNAAGDLHVITTGFPQGRIRHTIRLANGSWPYPFQLLPLPNIGQLRSVACATNSAGDLHILAELEEPAKIWHTIRRADGSWPYPFGDVEGVTSNIGAASGCACATNAAGDLHVPTSSDPQGKIWHTIRRADGSWPYPFGDVEAATSNIGVNFGHLACATNVAGDLHVLAGRPYLPYPP